MVGTGAAVEDGVGVDVGVGILIDVVESDNDDEEITLDVGGIGTGTDEETIGGRPPSQAPKPGRHPVPQKAGELPQ